MKINNSDNMINVRLYNIFISMTCDRLQGCKLEITLEY